MHPVLESIRGKLIVSCQALEEEPLHSSFIMSRMALAAKEGGAGRLAMADCSTYEECLAAAQMGFDIVSTTLCGYTPYSVNMEGPDFDLIRRCCENIPVPVIAEGKINTPEDLAAVFECGAFSAVVGGAITRPQLITRRFTDAIKHNV